MDWLFLFEILVWREWFSGVLKYIFKILPYLFSQIFFKILFLFVNEFQVFRVNLDRSFKIYKQRFFCVYCSSSNSWDYNNIITLDGFNQNID